MADSLDASVLRRPGYTPTHDAIGRRGRHTRELLLRQAAALFASRGFHGTSVEDIAVEVGKSRGVVYQYFPSKEAIFVELAHECERTVMEHGRDLTGLGADVDGVTRLRSWLHGWEAVYDRYAPIFLEFPGIGPVAGHPQPDAGLVSAQYTQLISGRLRAAGAAELGTDTAGAMLRIVHMVNLYRYRGMFGLPDGAVVSDSLAATVQLLLFPDTPHAVLESVIPTTRVSAPHDPHTPHEASSTPGFIASASITRRDILRTSALLFTERGYFATGMHDISAAAEIGRATLYRYFSTKMEILSELTTFAVDEGGALADELGRLADPRPDEDSLHAWLRRYADFHRRYGGVIRAWYDGTLGAHLADDVRRGLQPFHQAATQLLRRGGLPAPIHPSVAAAVFLSVLGRTSDIAPNSGEDTSGNIADRVMAILRRTLLPMTSIEIT